MCNTITTQFGISWIPHSSIAYNLNTAALQKKNSHYPIWHSAWLHLLSFWLTAVNHVKYTPLRILIFIQWWCIIDNNNYISVGRTNCGTGITGQLRQPTTSSTPGQLPRTSKGVCVYLTHWGRVTHICVSSLTIVASNNGLSPGRRQAIIWTNAGILLIRSLGTNFSEILMEIHTVSFNKTHLKMSSAKWRPCFLGLNVLNITTPGILLTDRTK